MNLIPLRFIDIYLYIAISAISLINVVLARSLSTLRISSEEPRSMSCIIS